MVVPRTPAQPAGTGQRLTRSSNTGARRSYADADFVADSEEEEDDEDFGGDIVKPPPKKKRSTNKTKVQLQKGPVNITDTPPTVSKTGTARAPREPHVERSQARTNLNNFYDLLPRLSVAPKAKFEYTPAQARPVHVLNCPVYENRDFRLIEEPTLHDTTHRDGRKTKAWRIRISDHNHPDHRDQYDTKSRRPPVLQPFQIPEQILRWYTADHGPNAKKPVPKSKTVPYHAPDGTVRAGIRSPESLRLCQSAVPTQKDAIDLAQVFCRVLNRAPMPLPSPTAWSARNRNNALIGSAIIQFTELVAMFNWNTSIDLTTVDTYGYSIDSRAGGAYEVAKSGVVRGNSFGGTWCNVQLGDFNKIKITVDPAFIDRTQAAQMSTPPGFAKLVPIPEVVYTSRRLSSFIG
ncbi:unnamed protein product [Zymoseptoria tritici ST99CH_3D1]|nr:unnamed protein product [Zymoseptoria tritici ST99CH_3D1]